MVSIIMSQKPAPIFWPGQRWLHPKLNGDKLIMSYRDSLNSWLVVRLLPKMQQKVVARCRTRSDADGHLQVLRRLMPDAEFTVLFDASLKLDS